MPRVVAAAKLAPKLHSSPLVWSQGSVRLQSSFSCLAQTLQQPQPSRTTLTPGAHLGISSGHSHTEGQEEEERTCTAKTTNPRINKDWKVSSHARTEHLNTTETLLAFHLIWKRQHVLTLLSMSSSLTSETSPLKGWKNETTHQVQVSKEGEDNSKHQHLG